MEQQLNLSSSVIFLGPSGSDPITSCEKSKLPSFSPELFWSTIHGSDSKAFFEEDTDCEFCEFDSGVHSNTPLGDDAKLGLKSLLVSEGLIDNNANVKIKAFGRWGIPRGSSFTNRFCRRSNCSPSPKTSYLRQSKRRNLGRATKII